MVRGRFLALSGLLALGTCRERSLEVPPALAPATIAAGGSCGTATADPAPRPLRRCFDELPAWVDSPVALLLDRAGDFLDRADADGALACAEEAARQMPRSVEAHHDRAVALIRLGRSDEARDALALALAIAPMDPETLELASDFYINHLPATAERSSIGLEFACRGRRTAGTRDKGRAGHLALLEGQALIDLGRAADSLTPLAAAQKLLPKDASIRYERGVALFEQCRFDDARRSFEKVLTLDPAHAHALYYLGLILERQGDEDGAVMRIAEAARRDSKSFPPIPDVSPPDFADRLKRITASLSADVRRDLQGISVQAAELPATDDLTAELPPLSPTILGLFRGLPLGRDEDRNERSTPSGRGGRGPKSRVLTSSASDNPVAYRTPERAIVLYRRNLLRSVQSVADLDRAIERTLLHEVGHLRGEDDGSLRDRGLE